MNTSSPLDLPLFQRLLQNLLKVTVYEYQKDDTVLESFEQKYCLYPPFQPMFKADTLKYLFQNMHENTIYEISDDLSISLTFFRFADSIYLVGPYVKNIFQESTARTLLLRHHLSASLILSMKLDYAQLPQLNPFYIEEAIKACISSFVPETSALYSRHLQGIREDFSVSVPEERGETSIQTIYRRYERENEWLSMVRRGDVHAISGALTRLFRNDFPSETMDAYHSPAYQNPLSVLRILARKAAQESGLSVITIDYITQKNVQKMADARTFEEMHQCIIEVVEELTQAVYDHLFQSSQYSTLVRKAVEYLEINYARNISLQELCRYLGLSVSYFSKKFKAETGMTVTQFLAALRCQHAAELLNSTSLSIQEISSYVGYLDNNYFVKVFKKQYGMTPSEYQRIKKTDS